MLFIKIPVFSRPIRKNLRSQINFGKHDLNLKETGAPAQLVTIGEAGLQ